jgi:hypothetical protein
VVLIKVTKSLVCIASFFASSASYYDMITIATLLLFLLPFYFLFFYFILLAALILKVMSLSLKMDLKQFFMWNHLAMPFMHLLMESLQVI